MAKLEDLIKQVRDDRLRTELAAEAAKLKAAKQFGLVFEEHLPETIQLPGLAPRPGNRVVRRGGDTDAVFVVTAVDEGGRCALVPEQGGATERSPAGEWVVVKRFGEPIYPTLTPLARTTRAADKPYHAVINADNFHALQLLGYLYEGRGWNEASSRRPGQG